MKKTILIVTLIMSVAMITQTSLAGHRHYYSGCGYYGRPVVVHHHYKSHCWHGSDWGKFAGGIVMGALLNEVSRPREPVYIQNTPSYVVSQPPVYQQPIYAQPTYYQQNTTYVRPVEIVKPITIEQTIMEPEQITTIQRPAIKIEQRPVQTTIIRQIAY